MKLRTGRKNGHNLYLQVGDEPADTDACVGFILDPGTTKLIVDQVNENPWTVNEIRLDVGGRAPDG